MAVGNGRENCLGMRLPTMHLKQRLTRLLSAYTIVSGDEQFQLSALSPMRPDVVYTNLKKRNSDMPW